MPPYMPIELRLKQKIDVAGINECWNWNASKDKQGYGKLCVNRAGVLAHRVVYEVYKEPIPTGMCVMHICDNPSCCNPNHLMVGTIADNNADRHRKNRSSGGSNKGRANAQNKLSEEDVWTIFRSNESLSKISAKFGISISTASDIKNGKIWGWMTKEAILK